MTSLDFNLAPKLYHAKVALKHYKDYDIPAAFDAVHQYMDRVFSSELFRKVLYTPETIIWGWSKHMK